MIKRWKQTLVSVTPGITTPFTPTTQANVIQIINRTASGGGVIYADDQGGTSLSTTHYALKVEQGNTGAIVRPYRLNNVYLTTDAAGTIQISIIEIETDDLSFVFNASEVLQIQGAVTVNQPITVNDLNTEVADGAANPSKGFMVAGTDGTDAHFLQVDASKNLKTMIAEALPAGTNVIGHVDVDSLPALPAGTNVIGHVDVDSLPALPAGTNIIGSVNRAGSSYKYSNSANAGAAVKASAGTLERVSINTGAAASTLSLYDNASAATTPIAVLDLSSAGEREFGLSFANGLYMVQTGTADITIVYR